MSMDPIEPLSPELADLFAREARAYTEDLALKAEVLAHVELAVALGGPTGGGGGGRGTPAPSPGGPAAKHAAAKLVRVGLLAFLAGGVVGGGAVSMIAKPPARLALPAPAASSAILAPVAVAPSAAAASTPAAVSSTAPSSAASASGSSPSGKVPARGDLARERELLDAARAALARGRTDDAIAAAERHAQKWPHGYLGEERDVVWIQALVAANRRDEAERRAARFRGDYPNSMLLPAVDAALSASP